MRVDAHQHFWDLGRFHYAWMTPDLERIRRNFLPDDLAGNLSGSHFDGSVTVQANTVLEETRWLLDLASRNTSILGVVGWVDLTSPELPRLLDELQRHPKFKGVRHPVHDEPDHHWLMREDVLGGLAEIARRGLPYDLLLRPRHLPLIPRLADRVPDLRVVIDHIAKPPIASGEFDDWAAEIERAAALPQVYAKLSGMITEANWRQWTADQLKPYVAHVLKVFGEERLMFGSDWPVCLLAGTWKQVLAAFTQALGPMPAGRRAKMLGETAADFYRLSTPSSR